MNNIIVHFANGQRNNYNVDKSIFEIYNEISETGFLLIENGNAPVIINATQTTLIQIFEGRI